MFQNFALIDDMNVYDNLNIVIDKKKKNTESAMIDALELVGLNKDFYIRKYINVLVENRRELLWLD